MEYLAEAGPYEILEALSRPAELERLAMHRRLRELVQCEGVLVSEHRLLERWIAEMSLLGFEGREPFEAWLDVTGRTALDAVRSYMEVEDRDDVDPTDTPDHAYLARIAATLDVEARFARKACLAVHSLPRRTRVAFRAIVVDRHGIKATAARLSLDVDELADRVRVAFRTIHQFMSEENPFARFLEEKGDHDDQT